MRFDRFALIAFLLASGTGAASGQATGTPSLCAPANDPWAEGMQGYLRNVLTKPEFFGFRDRIGLPAVDISTTASVQVEEVCSKAAIAMNKDRKVPLPAPRKVYVVKVGAVYWVEDPTYMVGEYVRGLVFDSTFTKILGIPGR